MRPGSARLPELALRMLVAAALVIGAGRVLQVSLIRPLLPVFGATVVLLAPQFTVQSLEVIPAQAPVVRLRANLLEPVEYAGHTVYPIGWMSRAGQGGYQVELSLTGLLQYPALIVLIVLAWPAPWITFLIRLPLGLALAAGALLSEAPVTLVAELWGIVRDQADPGAPCYWMIASRFLMGGGGLLIAGLLACAAILLAQRLRQAPPVAAFA